MTTALKPLRVSQPCECFCGHSNPCPICGYPYNHEYLLTPTRPNPRISPEGKMIRLLVFLAIVAALVYLAGKTIDIGQQNNDSVINKVIR